MNEMSDKLICGLCCHKEENIILFLQHKAQHTETRGAKCQLCGLREYALLEHYDQFHKIVVECSNHSSRGKEDSSNVEKGTCEKSGSKDNQDKDPNEEDSRVQVPAEEENANIRNYPDEVTHMSSPDLELIETDNSLDPERTETDDSVAGSGMRNKVLHEYSGSKDTKNIADESVLTNNKQSRCDGKSSNRDFYFLLSATEIGNSDIGAIQCLKCLHCDFITPSDHALSQHMKDYHFSSIQECDMLDINTLSEDQKRLWSDNDLIIKFSEFLSKHKKKQKGLHNILLNKGGAIFSCPKCAKTFKTIKYLRRHLVTHRPKNERRRFSKLENENFRKLQSMPESAVKERKQNIKKNLCSIANRKPDNAGSTNNESPPKRRKRFACEKEEKEGTDFYFLLSSMDIKSGDIGIVQCLKCLHCDFITPSDHGLLKHMKDNHDNSIRGCENLDFNSLSEDQKRLWNDSDKIIKFSEFRSKYKKRQKGLHSILVKKDIDCSLFSCPKCDKAYKTIRFLRHHLKTHRTKCNFLCDECGSSFKDMGKMNDHKRRSHGYGARRESEVRIKRYTCRQCGFSSSVYNLIHSHCQLHPDVCVKCDVCGLAYSDEYALSKHKMVHDPKRPYPCPVPQCNWRFNNKVVCDAHYMNHGEHRCVVCDKRFKNRTHRVRHQKNLHGVDADGFQISSAKIPEKKPRRSVYKAGTDTEHSSADNDQTTSVVNSSEVVTVSDQKIGPSLVVDNSDIMNETARAVQDCSAFLNNGNCSKQILIVMDSDGNPVNYEITNNTTLLISHQQEVEVIGGEETLIL